MARQMASGLEFQVSNPAVFRLVRDRSQEEAARTGIGLEPDANAAAGMSKSNFGW